MASDTYQDAGAADLPLGGTRCLDLGGRAVLVARGQDGQYRAVAAQCSHAAMSLDGGRVRGSSIVCPHHGARFDLASGRVLGPPAYAPIAAFPTRVTGDRVQVWVYS